MTTNNTQIERENLVRAHMADENTHDFDKVLAEFPHPHYEVIPTDKIYDGRPEVSSYYQNTRRLFPDQRNELISLRHTEDAVIVEFWLMGSYQGAGNSFKVRMTAFFIFEGTTLVCERVYFDVLTMVKQLIGSVSLLQPSSLLHALRVLRVLQQQSSKNS
jgi:hypothetical protein